MLHRCLLIALILLVFVSASPSRAYSTPTAVAARPPLKLELRDHRGGEANAVFVRDTYAYAGFGIEFAVLDVANPATPQRRGFALMPDVVTDVAVVGQYAFVLSYRAGLWVVDISNPDAPTIVGNVALPGVNTRLEVVGSYAYIVGKYTYVGSDYFEGGLSVVDITVPREPLLVSRYEHGSGGLDIVGDYLFLTDLFEGLMILDITDPRSIKLLAAYDLDEHPYDVAVQNRYAYVITLSGLRIIDVSNPAVLVEVGVHEMSYSGDRDVEIVGEYAYIATLRNALRIVDVSDPTHPTQVSPLLNNMEGNGAALALKGSYAYIADQFAGLSIINIADVTAPTSVGFAAYAAPTSSSETVIYNDYVYTGGYNYSDNSIFDVRNPDKLSFVGTLEGKIKVVDEGYAYGMSESSWVGIWSLANPTSPTVVGSYRLSNATGAVSVNYPYMYTSDQGICFRGGCYGGGLHVVDISDRSAPKQVAWYRDVVAHSLVSTEKYLYAAVKDTVFIYEASNPQQLVVVGQYQPVLSEFISHIVVQGSYIYVVTASGVRIVDISTPAQPVERSVVPIAGGRVVVSGSYAYVASNNSVYVVDITNASRPSVIASYTLPGKSNTSSYLAVDGDMLYLAANGLFALRLTEAQLTDYLYLPSLSVESR